MASSTKRTLAKLGIAIAVLVALFATSIVCSSARTAGSGCSKEDRERLRVRFLRTRPVTSNELAGCIQRAGQFQIAKECTLKVARAGAWSRKLLISAVDVTIELSMTTEADGRSIPQRAKLEPGQSKELFVGKAGIDITLRCMTGVVCRAVVQ